VAALAYAAAALLITSGFATITVGLFTPLLGWRLGPLEFGEDGGAFLCVLTGVGIAIFAGILSIRARPSAWTSFVFFLKACGDGFRRR
jgi:hypothetical protein